jgi:predicted GNAT family acetyltransferase
MEIKILQPGDEAALEAFLIPRVASSMFLISNLRSAGLVDNGQRFEGTYAAAFEGEKIVGVVAHYQIHNTLILQAPTDLLEPLWRAALKASGRPVKGLIGPLEQVRIIEETLSPEPSNIQFDEPEKLYSLRLDQLIEPEALHSGQVRGRLIQPDDLELVIKWRIAYSLETLAERDTPELHERCRASMERSLKDKTTWLLEDQEKVVACSSFNAIIKEAVQVGGVWTPPALRRRGYGRAVVAASLLHARDETVQRAILFTGEHNIAAQKAYAALGFRQIGYYRLLLFHEPL